MGIKLCLLSLLTASPMPSKSILSCISPPRPWLYLFWLSDATADVLSTRPFLFILLGLQWIPLPSLSQPLSLSVSPSLYLASLSCIWQGFTCCILFLCCPFWPSWLKKKPPPPPKCASARLLYGVCSDVGCHVAWVSMVWRVLLGPPHSWDQCFTNLLQVVFGDPSSSHYVPLLRVCLPDWRNSCLVHATLL